MVEERRVHGFSQEIVATERKREVAHSAAHLCARKISLYPGCSFDEVESIAVVLLHAGGYCQHIGVKDDIFSLKIYFLSEQSVGARAYLFASRECIGLTVFVKSHHNHGGTHLFHIFGMAEKHLFTLFQTYRIDNAFALQTFQPGFNHRPFRRVNHHRHFRHIRLCCQKTQKMGHFRFGIKHGIVHINIYHLSSRFHLRHSDAYRLVVVFLVDKTQKLPTSRHITTLSDVYEI